MNSLSGPMGGGGRTLDRKIKSLFGELAKSRERGNQIGKGKKAHGELPVDCRTEGKGPLTWGFFFHSLEENLLWGR